MPAKADHRSPGLQGSILCDIICELLSGDEKRRKRRTPYFFHFFLEYYNIISQTVSQDFSESENNPTTKPLSRFVCIRNIEVSEFPKPSVSVKGRSFS